MRRRGQSQAPHAANLILVIILLLSLYIMFVPPSERARILEGTEPSDDGDTGTGGGQTLNSSTLLAVHPGRLSYLQDTEFEHVVPSFYLYSSTESVVLKDLNAVYVSSSAFGQTRSRNVTLSLDDVASLKNVLLTFEAETARGVLTIVLNGEVIYENEIVSQVVEPIRLSEASLKEENELSFSVSSPGWRFWQPNEYRLEKVRIVGDRTDLSKQQSTNIFYISPEEASNVQSATLSFLPKCENPGPLQVLVNGNIVFSNVPDCNSQNRLQFNPQQLFQGSNNVVFAADSGSYLLEQIKVSTKLREDASVVYHFDINSSQMSKLRLGTKHVTLKLEFVDSGKEQEGELVVNGHRSGFFTRDRVFEKRIDAYVQEGGNAIRLVPKTTMDVANLVVKYN